MKVSCAFFGQKAQQTGLRLDQQSRDYYCIVAHCMHALSFGSEQRTVGLGITFHVCKDSIKRAIVKSSVRTIERMFDRQGQGF